jgi:hypothetical protein
VKACEIGVDLMNQLVAGKVDLVLQGHDHNYQRSRQLALGPGCSAIWSGTHQAACVADDGADGAYAKGAGPVLVIQGTFAQPLYEVRSTDPEAAYFASSMGANLQPTKGFVRYEVTPTQLSGAFVASDGGGFSDRFTITR